MLAPSIVLLVAFVRLPARPAVVLGQPALRLNGDNCRSNGWDQYVDVFRSTEFQNALW